MTISEVDAHRSRARDAEIPPPAERRHLRANVGGLLRQERWGRGWSQRDLAAAAGCANSVVAMLECGLRRPSESTTRRLAQALRPDGPPVEVAVLDLRLQRAAGASLRRWRRRRPPSARRARLYAEAAARLDGPARVDPAEQVAVGRLLAALAPPWRGQR